MTYIKLQMDHYNNKRISPESRFKVLGNQWPIFAALILQPIAALHSASAQSIWNGNGTNNNWSTPANWASGTTPSNTGNQTVTFAGSVRLSPVTDSPWSVLGLTFATGAGAFTLSGSTLTLGSSGITQNATSLQTISNAIDLAGNQTWTATGGNLSVTGLVNLNAARLTLSPASARIVTLSNVVSGNGSLAKSGAGTVVLSAANTFTGGVTLTAGTLTAGSDTAFGAGLLALQGGTLNASAARFVSNNVAASGTVAFAGNNQTFGTGTFTLTGNTTLNTGIALVLNNGLAESGGARSLTKSGAGVLTINNSLGITGPVTISAGVLALGTGVTLPASNLALGGGTLAASGAITRTLGTGAGQLRFTGSGGFAALGGNLSISGVTGVPIWGTTADFLQNGNSLLLGSTIATGVVTWSDSFSLGAGNRTVNVSNNTATTADRAALSGVISGTGDFVKAGTGVLDLTGNNTFTGRVWIQAGEVATSSVTNAAIAGALGAGSAIAIGSGTGSGSLRYLGGAGSTDRAIQLAGSTGGATIAADGSGPLVIDGGLSGTAAGDKTLTLTGTSTGANQVAGVISNGAGAIAVSKSGTGRWILSNANTYSRGTALSAGELTVGNNNALGTGALNWTGGRLSGTGGPISLANAVTVGGTVVLGGSAPLTFSGNVAINGSRTITVSNTAASVFSGPVLTFTAANATSTLTINGANDLTILSVIQNGPGSGPDGLTMSGTGRLTLSAANLYSGTTTLSSGTLAVGDNLALGSSTFALNGGTLVADNGARVLGNTVTLGGNAIVGGALALSLTGNITLTGSRTLTVNNSSDTTLGNIALSNSATSRTLTMTGSGTTVVSGVISNGGTATASALTKTGANRVILSGANTYGGATTVSSGTLEIRNNAALGTTVGTTTVASGASLALTGNITTAERVFIAGTGAGGAGAIVNISGNNSITTTITQTAASTINATGGTLNISPAAGNSVSGNFALTIAGSGNVVASRAVNIGSATLTKAGAGTAVLGFAGNNIAGAVSVTGGTLTLARSLTAATLSVATGASVSTLSGSSISAATTLSGLHNLGPTPATTTFSNGLSYASTSQLSWNLANNSALLPGTNFDQVLVTGGNLTVTSGSTLALGFNSAGSTVNWSNAFWSSDRQWTVIDFSGPGSSVGNFSSINITNDAAGQSLASVRVGASFSVSRIGTDIVVNYAAVPEPSTLVLLGLALAFVCHSRFRRSAKAQSAA